MAANGGAYLRYALKSFGSRQALECTPISYIVRLPSDSTDPPPRGLFLNWSPGGSQKDAPHEAEQSLAITYAPAAWAKVSELPGTRLLDNEGKDIGWGPSSTRVWPAFGHPGGAFEAIWECSG